MSDTIKPAKLAPNILNSCYLARALKCLKVISVLFSYTKNESLCINSTVWYLQKVWKNKFSLTKKIFREIDYLVTSLEKRCYLLSRNFSKKDVKE